MDNILLCTDSYKVTHHRQYPPGTTKVYSYFSSRGGKYDNTVFFGLQYIIHRYLSGSVVNELKIEEAREYFKYHFRDATIFNEEGWMYIVNKHCGYLPIEIKAVPEGTIINNKNVLFTVENTDPKCFWLVGYLETLLVQVWCPMTVATNSYHMFNTLMDYMEKTSDSKTKHEDVSYKLHDFGCRGVSSMETAGIAGLAHLAAGFKGSDTVPALYFGKKYYRHGPDAGYSIPAMEHSTVTSWHKEEDAFKNMLEQFPTGLVACVSDSYDIFDACHTIWGQKLKKMVESRDGCLVIRPDSGNPLEVLPMVFQILSEQFGFTTNSKGYKVLPPKIRVIQGDGIDAESMKEILDCLTNNKWSTDNIAFGSGGGLLQKHNRDTLKCAMKCSYIEVNGKGRSVFKDPITDKGKTSMKGTLRLVKQKNNVYKTYEETHLLDGWKHCEGTVNCLKTVLKDGTLYGTHLDNIRGRIEKTMISQRLANFSKDVMPELRLPPTMNSQTRPVSATV